MKKLLFIALVVFFAIGNIMAQDITFSASCPTGQTINFKIIDSERLYVEVASDNDVTGVLEIPETVSFDGQDFVVTKLGDNAFHPYNSSHHGPRVVTLPNTIKVIGVSAFEDCTNLLQTSMPSSIDSILSFAFANCDKLTSITIPSSVTFLGEYVFGSCDRLQTVLYEATDCRTAWWPFLTSGLSTLILSDSVRRIPDFTFEDTEITGPLVLPESLTYLGQNAFHNCDKITSVHIPKDMDTIIESFSLCDNIDTVFYDAIHAFTPDYYTGAFASSGVKTIVFGDQVESLPFVIFSDCTNLDTLALPNSLKRIGDYAFYRCSSLTALTIPEHVEYIGWNAFYSCSGIQSIHCKPLTPPEIEPYTFNKIPTDIEVTIPCHSDYPHALYWDYFTNFVEDCNAVGENEAEDLVHIYPNPTTGWINIDLDDITDIEVYDITGQKILQDNQTQCIDLSDQPNGVYLLRITTKERTIEKELIKQ